LKTLDEHTHDIPNGFEIDNDGLDEIDAEFKDVGDHLDRLDSNGWGDSLEHSFKNAFQEQHMQQVGRELDAWGKTANAHQLDKELKDVDNALKRHVKVTDIPQH